jgi:hypothetical protein
MEIANQDNIDTTRRFVRASLHCMNLHETDAKEIVVEVDRMHRHVNTSESVHQEQLTQGQAKNNTK